MPGRIPDDPGRVSRDSGTKKPHRMYVDLDLSVPARPARPLTLAVLAVTAAVTATILAVGGGVLAVFGRDVSINPVSTPSHPRGAFLTRIEDDQYAVSLTGVLELDPAPFHLCADRVTTRS